MSTSFNPNASASNMSTTRTTPPTKKLSKISKKLAIKKERPVPMNDLPLDAPPVDCPPVYECYVTMKPLKKHRLSITKRYFGKVIRGLMRLLPEKGAKATNEVIGSEYTVDLTAVAISCDDSRRRLIFKFKKESRDIGPVNKNEYETFKEMIQKHRNYRQSACRNKKEDFNELMTANAYQSNELIPITGRISSLNKRPVNPEQDIDTAKLREDFRGNTIAELNEKVVKILNDIKTITIEMKQMRKELKELIRSIQSGKTLPTMESKEDEQTSDSDNSDEKSDAALLNNNQTLFDALPKQKSKINLSEEIIDRKEEKPERLVEGGELEKIQSRKRRDQLPKASVAGEELGLRQLMAIVARRLPLPITFFEPLTMLQVLCEELRYSGQTLNRAISAYDPVDRIAYVTAFAVSSYSGMVCRKQKPFNPLLGETFDFVSDEGWKYHAEQVNRHPSIMAAHAEGLNWEWWQTLISTPKTSWSGVIEATPELPVRLRLGKEDYCWNRVKVIIENASSTAEYRKLKMDGTMNMRCSNGYTSTVIFRKDRQTEVYGSIMDNRGILVVKLFGYYDRFLQKVNQKEYLFEAIPLPKNANQYYGFSQFACGLNEFLNIDERLSAPSTDSRFRPDLKALENADTARAFEAKTNLEKLQRARNEAIHKRMWFEQRHDLMTNTTLWVCNGRYWQAKEKKFKVKPLSMKIVILKSDFQKMAELMTVTYTALMQRPMESIKIRTKSDILLLLMFEKEV
uniref:Oxysterol-binding protein n=1 Tax=Loa loa TaxID=7209 RepID=A0A1I7VYD4_LOALO